MFIMYEMFINITFPQTRNTGKGEQEVIYWMAACYLNIVNNKLLFIIQIKPH